jgi:hypothetical protein
VTDARLVARKPKLRRELWIRGKNPFHTGWLLRVFLEPRPENEAQAVGWDIADDTSQERCLLVLQQMISRGDLIVGPMP